MYVTRRQRLECGGRLGTDALLGDNLLEAIPHDITP